MYKLNVFKVQTLNKISPKGLDLFPRDHYEFASEIPNPDAVLLRSFKMHDMELPHSLKAIARAGAGVNNIPIDKCTENGIIVFNTPGANANAVKELVVTALMISSRQIIEGINWGKSLIGRGSEVPKLIEEGKSNFVGPEISGKTLGIVGLGAIGVLVANAAEALGMRVIGYDPYISVESAWELSQTVKRAPGLESLLNKCDYISLHAPLTDDTRGYINRDKFHMMKKGVRLLNFARGGLVNNHHLLEAIEDGIVNRYVTDFPDESLLKQEKVIAIPHLGASTPESEENCAMMAVEQLREYLENGNIRNSVNFPTCSMERNGGVRLLIANKNIPKMIGQITAILADQDINIANMINKHYDHIAYNIIDIDGDISAEQVKKIKDVEGIVMVRALPAN
ncbi:MAG: phosphoglycerate dehydrogenase [Candidatus Cyclobacteriaceae bacterium M3_2C_046]